MPQHLRTRVLSAEGGELYGGRYNPKGTFGALYLGESPAVCLAEIRKATPGRTLGALVQASVTVQLQRVLDLTDGAVLERLGLRREDLVTPDWAPTQHIGRLIREAGFEAILVPSAAAPGTNLVLFPDQLDSASSLQLTSIHPTEA